MCATHITSVWHGEKGNPRLFGFFPLQVPFSPAVREGGRGGAGHGLRGGWGLGLAWGRRGAVPSGRAFRSHQSAARRVLSHASQTLLRTPGARSSWGTFRALAGLRFQGWGSFPAAGSWAILGTWRSSDLPLRRELSLDPLGDRRVSKKNRGLGVSAAHRVLLVGHWSGGRLRTRLTLALPLPQCPSNASLCTLAALRRLFPPTFFPSLRISPLSSRHVLFTILGLERPGLHG